MARILEKTVESVESLLSPFSTSYGFQTLMQKCISTRTKREEEGIIGGCLHLVKTKLSEPSPSHRSVVNCLSFVVFADLLGYPAPYAHIHAVKLAGSSSVVLKKIGYLFCSYLIGPSHELMLLMVNTMVRDLAIQSPVASPYDSSNNPLAVAAALTATCYLTPLDSVSTILPLALDKLNHPSPFVRAKAVSSIQHLARKITGNRFFSSSDQLSSFLLGKPSAVIRKLLSDPHPAVLGVGLQFIQSLAPQIHQIGLGEDIEESGSTLRVKEEEIMETNYAISNYGDTYSPEDNIFHGLAPALVHVQKQILQGKMPTEYIFHSVPSPWIQLSIIRLLRFIRKEEIVMNGIHELLIETFRSANRRVLIGWAIIIECVLTAVEIDTPESFYHEIGDTLGKLVIESGTGKDTIPKWLSSNLLHTSLSLVQVLGKKHIAAVEAMLLSPDMQDGLRSSLCHSDPSIRRLAVGLVTSCGGLSSHDGNRWTAEKICLLLLEECSPKKMQAGRLSHIPMEQWKRECLERIVDLTSSYRFPQDGGNSWQLAVLLRSLPLAPDRNMAILIRDRIQRFLLPPGDWEDLGNVTRSKVLKLLEKHCQSKCASTYLLELYIWVLSQFYHLVPDTNPLQILQQLINLGQKVLYNNKKGSILTIVDVLIALVQAISHIILKKLRFEMPQEKWNSIVESVQSFLLDVCELDGTPRLFDVCSELSKALPHAQTTAEVLTKGSTVELSSMDFTLSFLDDYICEKLGSGECIEEASSSVPYESFPIDYYNAELATNVRRQISLGLPLHCHPWKITKDSKETKDIGSLDLSSSLSLTILSQSSNVPSSHGTSLPDEFLSVSLESQPKGFEQEKEEIPMNESQQNISQLWTSAGRVNLSQYDVSSGTETSTTNKTASMVQISQTDPKSQQDLLSLLLHTGNSGIVLDQSQAQTASADPLDRLLSDGFQISDIQG